MIPKYFYIFGEKVTVSKIKEIDKGKSYGEFDLLKNKIRLAKTVYKHQINEDQVEQAYFHELVHCMLEHLGYDSLSEDEKFVDNMGKALHQILTTSKYE